ncbi:methylated-DNA--protein-cysteine methyltransferase [Bacillus carboniphilus]|uniref:Methylated-DNA--protein-cysteine methyltransferase n=1 Tax=Bacillus carboniphilus TaxID=86663 RepID=A0ABP3FTP2_9BACI
MEKISYQKISSPIGDLWIIGSDEELYTILFDEEELKREWIDAVEKETPVLKETVRQLHEYFQGERSHFQVPLKLKGTAFQKTVWNQLQTIEYGKTKSYGEIAELIGNPKAVRAVGQANRANPVPIIIPCHRVIGKNQKLVGYAGNRIELKETLLKLESTI